MLPCCCMSSPLNLLCNMTTLEREKNELLAHPRGGRRLEGHYIYLNGALCSISYNLIFSMTSLRKYCFDPLTQTLGLRVCLQIKYFTPCCYMCSCLNLISNMTLFRKEKSDRLTYPGMKGVCKDRTFSFVVPYAPFSLILICNMITFRKNTVFYHLT